ncbi:DUF2750 domain-containing protein [Colwellia sp. 6_MG-2023]|uniref:DUF2750 domain-containing protein n=1 Tax=Colwellia sp. 6_MG-2023 TaxID=3062676 RepID=UPI0026E1C994|nr:DUF2750 domain-containing protein [Colwellia sp. 6_MG-2023]MDO6488365.1 DUF2750 domain-containing protein [Colwellia sp. 6_MG-2023]
MSLSEPLNQFIKHVETTQTFYGLQEPKSQEWVILDSVNFEEHDVMPLWSTTELASVHIADEWADYVVAPITVADWLEFWVEDLSNDPMVIGVDWRDEDNCAEYALSDYSQAIISIEKYV